MISLILAVICCIRSCLLSLPFCLLFHALQQATFKDEEERPCTEARERERERERETQPIVHYILHRIMNKDGNRVACEEGERLLLLCKQNICMKSSTTCCCSFPLSCTPILESHLLLLPSGCCWRAAGIQVTDHDEDHRHRHPQFLCSSSLFF